MTHDQDACRFWLRRRTPEASLAYLEAGRASWITGGIPAAAIDALIADAKQVIARERQENQS